MPSTPIEKSSLRGSASACHLPARACASYSSIFFFQAEDGIRYHCVTGVQTCALRSMGYRGYGLPISEVVSEGNVGLMQAVKRFEPEKGFRLATYAMWWIKASIQEYILRSWSLVKMGTT